MDGPVAEDSVDIISEGFNEEIDSLLTAGDVANLLRVHINTVRRWSNLGILPSLRIGARGDRRFRKEDIDSFLPK